MVYEDVVEVHVAQDRVQWWDFVDTIMNLRVP
jgi:predicted RNA-binding protein